MQMTVLAGHPKELDPSAPPYWPQTPTEQASAAHKRTALHFWLISGVALLSACLGTPTNPETTRTELLVTAYNAAGQPVPLHALPLRPTLLVHHNSLVRLPLILLHGPPDRALLAELAAPPLSRHDQTREVPASVHHNDQGTWLTPTTALARGERYTLAIPNTDETTAALEAPPYAVELAIDRSAQAGASLIASLPADGQVAVPQSLGTIQLVFDGALQSCSGFGLYLTSSPNAGTHQTIPGQATPCLELDDRGVYCCQLGVAPPLAPNESYELRADTVVDPHGAPPWVSSVRFHTAPHQTSSPPPSLAHLPCASDEDAIADNLCIVPGDHGLSLRFLVEAPLALTLQLAEHTLRRLTVPGPIRLDIDELQANTAYEGLLHLRPLGAASTRIPIATRTSQPLATVTISEVLADPLGPEPDQEYVELHNFGLEPQRLDDLSLTDKPAEPGTAIATQQPLAPGASLLLVPLQRDYQRTDDPQPPPGAPILPLGTKLLGSGLANGGEALFLRDKNGRRVAASPAIRAPAGTCLKRRSEGHPRWGRSEDFHTGACDPGR